MSPRAACRLVTLGFDHVFDYMPGKVDWMARGLPVRGTKAEEPRAIDFVRSDVVTCRLDDQVSAVRERVAASPYGSGFVTTGDGVLLGRLRKSRLAQGSGAVGEVMEPGPSTTRPDTPPGKLAKRLRDSDLTTAVLTDPEGRLLGIVRRTDLEA